jgi:hypothetical protein
LDPRPSRGLSRRRIAAAGLAAGLLAGAAAGTALFTGAAPTPAGPRPLVLHAAPALVPEGRPVELTVGTFCPVPDHDACAVDQGELFASPGGVDGWTAIPGAQEEGAFRFTVPGGLVPPDGFSYWVRLTTRDGGAVAYPPGGADSPLRVVTTAGLPVRDLEAFDWDVRARPAATAARLPFGELEGQVGVRGGGHEQALDGPSSFEVGADGRLNVVDWANRRLQILGPSGGYRRSIALPAQEPMDVAVTPGGTMFLSTLGAEATVYELSPEGALQGSYPVGYGITTRVSASSSGPRVLVGTSQWAAVRAGRGVPMPPEAQARSQTTSVSLADGSVGVSQSVGDDAIAFAWTRPDGSRGGLVLRLPLGVFPGSDYFVRPLGDGGAIAARGLWGEADFGVGLFRFDATGGISSFQLLPAPSTRMAAHLSVVRYRPPFAVLAAFDEPAGIRIDRFEVG